MPRCAGSLAVVSAGRTIRLLREGFTDPPGMDTAVSRALLERVSAGLDPETLRVHRPGPVLAFGPRDRLASGFARAVEAARAYGFEPILRLAGGRAAVFHQDTIALSWVRPDPEPRRGITARFEEVSAIMAGALRRLGIDARVGEVPGEYCPGAHSVNARGRTKLMGVGQRLVQHAAHVGGVVVVGGGDRIRDVLIPVYDELGLAWDPDTVGSVEDEIGPVTWETVATAIIDELSREYRLEDGHVSVEALARAGQLVSLIKTA
jgi:octanoyl-[GcvH]:protein N-octanoyltransferase